MNKTSMNILAGLMAGAGLLLSAGAQAQDAFPTKPIRIVLGFPAGGPLDQHARLLTDKLQGVHLYGLARPSRQAAAPRLSALTAAELEAIAAVVRKETGLKVVVSP